MEQIPMVIRVLSPEDASTYRELRLQALQHNPEAFTTTYHDYVRRPIEQIQEQLRPTPDKVTLAAFSGQNSDLLGTVTMVRNIPQKTRHIAEVVAMHVALLYRRRGIGKALLQDLIQRARHVEGLDQLRLAVVTENTAAINLYQSVGFRLYGIEPSALKSGDRTWDEALMALVLKRG